MSFYFAAVGDVHGCQQTMVRLLSSWEASTGNSLAFVLQVGDFEPHRDETDVACMSAPSKYRRLGDFHRYHQGRDLFPWPVAFIGGNHEPYNYLDTYPEGGRLIDNCHYLGRVGVLEWGGLRIGGLSGIYSEDHFKRRRPGPQEIGDRSPKEYIYFNKWEVDSLLQAGPLDVLLLHDWPAGIVAPSDYPTFRQQRRAVDPAEIGNEYGRILTDLLQPKLVCCGHMHRKYRNTVYHRDAGQTAVVCLDAIHAGWPSLGLFHCNDSGEITELATTAR